METTKVKHKKDYNKIKWIWVIWFVCILIINILIKLITGNQPHPLLIGIVSGVGVFIVMYVQNRMRIKYGIIATDERIMNLQHKASNTTITIFIIFTGLLCLGVWFAEFFDAGKFDVAIPFTQVLAYVLFIILVIYAGVYFYYQRKM